MVVHNVQRKATVDGDAAAFVFVACKIGRQVRHHIPDINDPMTHVDVGIEDLTKSSWPTRGSAQV
jgi:hypothetical protein